MNQPMDPRLAEETERLHRSWMQHRPEMLRDYLVADVQDPLLNVQSIQGRHFLIEALCGDRYAPLHQEELRFAVVMHWLVELLKDASDIEQLQAVLHALRQHADDAEGMPVPVYVRHAFADLPRTLSGATVPNYLADFLEGARPEQGRLQPCEESRRVFEKIWWHVLENEKPDRAPVLEAACGSANDYRCFESFGLARLMGYTGFDLCETNIANARAMFPGARFEVRNVFDTGYADKSVDYGLAHDLLEHLSLEGLEVAVAELCRVTRKAMCIGFFQMHEGEEHIVRQIEEYHINTLSLPRVRELFARFNATVQAVHINTFLNRQFGCEGFYNDQAYTITVAFPSATSGKAAGLN